MTDTKKGNWVSRGYAIFSALLFVFGFLSIAGSRLITQLSEFRTERMQLSPKQLDLGSGSIAPENLARAPESFWLGLRVEALTCPTDGGRGNR
jgi:hypothetical protein